MANFILRSLRGSNLEIFKFALYLSFPIGWMYYFGTNLEERFSVPDFWPTQEQSHKIPYEKADIKAEVQRIQQEIQARKLKLETERKEGEREMLQMKARDDMMEGFGRRRVELEREAEGRGR